MFGISNLAIVPIRLEPSDRSEQVSQLLFGDHFKILEQIEKWVKIETAFDSYIGWIDNKQFLNINEDQFNLIENSDVVLNGDFIEYITTNDNQLIPIPLGSCVSSIDSKIINTPNFLFEGSRISGIKDKSNIIKTAFMYLNTPYLWGGKSPFGIDCSGFTQMVYKLNGYKILRDASQQSSQGEALSFIEESEPGDLAFFDNDEGNIIHVGIMMDNNYIIHASGKVRIDRLDHLGIYNAEINRHTHKLRVIKKII
ncbi:hydrolase Nlp/P60 [Flavobacterium sp. 316]|uniref:C40 family peptidase n=1 Tax=Flavobacterium sediminilitoris TaxID=2024526 RepID=A0ABY4HKL8_9FLAO|nr:MULTISPECIES: C40 family peptidase [Flavobacterium]KIX22587.1 hydrolase Nlp/P60 [Flavobacterium sp. 316]UOX33402.1 C40 family peptidase [Flavobacterium sediminilitoris]